MKLKGGWLLIAALVVVIAMIGWTGYAQKTTSPTTARTAWEYKVVHKFMMSEQELNELGAQGWDLVQYDPGVRGGGGSTSESFFFKRAK